MNYRSGATSPNYQEQFNKELSQRLKSVRQAQPNHIPVFAMKYKNASKYLIEDLQQPLALFPKKFLLRSVHDLIQKQSLQFCQNILKSDPIVISQGNNFKVPPFYLYTISMINSDDDNCEKSAEVSQKSSKPIGKFIKLDLEMTFQQVFEKYGRDNVLTVVYTDATEINIESNRMANRVQKCLTRVIIFILILVLIPFLMKSQPQNLETINSKVITKAHQYDFQNQVGEIGLQNSLTPDMIQKIDVVDQVSLSLKQEKWINYDEESI